VTIRELYRMAIILQSNPVWDALVEQIYVEDNGEWILIPRAGGFEILFGMPVNMETKMKRVDSFIKKYLPKMGWDRYSRINLKFDNQIICTKK
jgi:cell division protein FtsQ